MSALWDVGLEVIKYSIPFVLGFVLQALRKIRTTLDRIEKHAVSAERLDLRFQLLEVRVERVEINSGIRPPAEPPALPPQEAAAGA